MYNIAIGAVVLLMLVSALYYVHCAWTRKNGLEPVPATWILMTVMMSLALAMYRQSPHWSLTANPMLTAGIVNVLIILGGVIAANMHHGTLRVAFNTTQKVCLALGTAVAGFWYVSRDPLTSYVLVQVIGLIAYSATVAKLWHAKHTGEPLLLWGAILVAGVCSIYPAWLRGDPFAWIYLARFVPSTILMIYLILRIRRCVTLA